eukprot:282927_1
MGLQFPTRTKFGLTCRCLIASLICFWSSLFCYVSYMNMTVTEDDEIESVMIVDMVYNNNNKKHSEFNINNIKQTEPNPSEISQQIQIPNMLTISPPIHTNTSYFKTICPLRENICMKNKHWITPHKTDIFNGKPSIRYCVGIVCNSFYAQYDKNIYSKCITYNNISIVLLGQYYPHMYSHIWSRTINGLWEYSIRLQVISMKHHFIFEQLDYFNLFMSHKFLIEPFSNYHIQHYKNLLLNPKVTLNHMNMNNNNYNVTKDESDIENNCVCVKEVYFCGFNSDFTKNYPLGFVSKTHPKDGNYYTWDRIEWYKQYWINLYSKSIINININIKMEENKFIKQYFDTDLININ